MHSTATKQTTRSGLAAALIATATIACAGDPTQAGGPDPGQPDGGAESAPDARTPVELPPVEADCDNLTPLPAEFTVRDNVPTSEDLEFDAEGHMINVIRGGDFFRTRHGEAPQLVAPRVTRDARGARVLPGGDIVVADMRNDVIYRVTPEGVSTPITTNLDSPNGIAVGIDGWIYVTGAFANQLYRVNPDTGASSVLTSFDEHVDGITFSPDYQTLYVNDFSGRLFQMGIGADGSITSGPTVLVPDVGNWPDGMAVDECGNIYVTDHGGPLRRVSPDGQVEIVADFGLDGFRPGSGDPSTPAATFGSGVGGWDAHTLYVMEFSYTLEGVGIVYEIPLGLRSKPIPHLLDL